MRVFYVDEEEPCRNYYVKVENVNLPDRLRGYISIGARDVEDLIEKIKLTYGFKSKEDLGIELWSGLRHTSQRLDIMDVIPDYNEFISVYVVNNSNKN